MPVNNTLRHFDQMKKIQKFSDCFGAYHINTKKLNKVEYRLCYL